MLVDSRGRPWRGAMMCAPYSATEAAGSAPGGVAGVDGVIRDFLLRGSKWHRAGAYRVD
jgi:hypothetical protein